MPADPNEQARQRMMGFLENQWEKYDNKWAQEMAAQRTYQNMTKLVQSRVMTNPHATQNMRKMNMNANRYVVENIAQTLTEINDKLIHRYFGSYKGDGSGRT